MVLAVAKSPREFALGDAGPALDRDALSAYRAELQEMSGMIEQAERAGDAVVLQQLQKERAELLAQFQQGRGLGGRVRKEGDSRERVRKAVRMAVRRAIDKIGMYDEKLAGHLRPPCLRCGAELCYTPPAGTAWET
jgi:hypothetical protein